ncbi:MAG TPA: diacylglycerol kinase [Gemmataceae bacterium]|nr:diacylglycerol kinase [Gemmataceae bacterium]
MSVLPRPPMMSEQFGNAPSGKPPRPWSHKFADAFRGLKFGMRGHSSFAVHFFFAALVIAGAIVLGCSLEQWCILLGCIGMVLAAELFNSALETLVRGLDEVDRRRLAPCLDIAAGAVLLASITAAIIGIVIFTAIFLRHFDVI